MKIYIFLVAILALAIYVVSIYNKLVTLRNRFKNAFAQIDVQLKRRYDLIPNLVEVAKGYLSHEKETLVAVIQARNSASAANKLAASNPGDPSAMMGLLQAETLLTKSVGGFFALSESYPDLKANTVMMQLTEELTSTENKISFARQAFNDAVTVYNTLLESFPSNIIASKFNFLNGTLFEIEDTKERQPVKTEFSKIA